MTDRLENTLRLLEDGADLDPDERVWLAAEVRRMRERRQIIAFCSECGQGDDLSVTVQPPHETRTMCYCGGMRSESRRRTDGGMLTLYSFTVPVSLRRDVP